MKYDFKILYVVLGLFLICTPVYAEVDVGAACLNWYPSIDDDLAIYAKAEGEFDVSFLAYLDILIDLGIGAELDFFWDIKVSDSIDFSLDKTLREYRLHTRVSRRYDGKWVVKKDYRPNQTETLYFDSDSDVVDEIRHLGKSEPSRKAFIPLGLSSSVTDAYIECRISYEAVGLNPNSDWKKAFMGKYSYGNNFVYYFPIFYPDDHSNQPEGATDISSISGSKSGLMQNDDVDFFKFTATAGKSYNIAFTSNDNEPMLIIQGGTDGYHEYTANLMQDESYQFDCSESGTYYAVVFNGSGQYNISINIEQSPPSKATSPSPSNGATDQSINSDLSWANGGGATSYDVYFGTDSTPDNGEFKGNQAGTSVPLNDGMPYNKTFYWRIDAKNTAGTTIGDVWSFTTQSAPITPPSKPTNPNPSNGATGQSINSDLSWSNGGGATSYDVYFGTDSTPDDGEYRSNQSGTNYDPGTLTYSTTYYWRIDAINADGITTGNVWSFTTQSVPIIPPSKPTNPNPSNGATGQSINSDLSWFNGGGATSYDVYFGTDSTPDDGEYRSNQSGTNYDPGTLTYSTTYYWRIDAINADGITTGNVWSFTTKSVTLSSILVTGPKRVYETHDAQYTCTAHYSDGNEYDVTSDADWNQDSGYASVDNSGYLKTLGVDSDQACRITATFGGESDAFDVTIVSMPDPRLYVEPETQYVGSNDGTTTVQVMKGGVPKMSWSASVTSGESWLSIISDSSGIDSDTITVAYSVNSTGKWRSGNLQIIAPDAEGSPKAVTIVQSGGGDGPMRSVPSQYPTIQSAVDECNDGDVVIVADGTYTGPGNRDIEITDKSITIRSKNGPDNCVINCSGSPEEPHRAFDFHNVGDDTFLDGFTITNGYSEDGGAILCAFYSDPIIKNCIIRNNIAKYGAAIMCDGHSNPYIENCVIAGNTAEHSGGGIYTDSGNCSPTITNCTIVGNSALTGGAARFLTTYSSASPIITNSILWDNVASNGHEISLYNWWTGRCPALVVSHSVVQGGEAEVHSEYSEYQSIITWGPGNVEIDPSFLSNGFWDGDIWVDGDYQLLELSPCIDAGDSGTSSFYDIDGNTRHNDPQMPDSGTGSIGYVDIGAYEFQGNSSPSNELVLIKGWGAREKDICDTKRNTFKAIAAGRTHNIALLADGTIVAWGNNDSGQCDVPNSNYPFTAIAAGNYHSIALRSDGSLDAWGDNTHGKCSVPQGNNYTAIAAGWEHNLALKSNGSIVAWGSNEYGKSTVPNGNDYISIAAGASHSLALRKDGSLVAWGNNTDQRVEVPAGYDYVKIAAGGWHSLALKKDGSIVAWGNNSNGQCDAPSGYDYISIKAGCFHSIALKRDGSLEVWGDDRYGQGSPLVGYDFVSISSGLWHNIAMIDKNSKQEYIEISGNANIYENSEAQYTCTYHDNDGYTSDITNMVSWSQNSEFASISDSGYLTTYNTPFDQPCKITASYNGKKDYFDLTIINIGTATRRVPSQYPTIQSAIDECDDGDTVIVADGNYTGDGNRDIDFKGKVITVRSENGPEYCIINCDGDYENPHRGFIFNDEEGHDAVVDGFKIVNGYAPTMGDYVYSWGGGIYCASSPTIKNCIFENNIANAGAGIYCKSDPIILNCIIKGNGDGYTIAGGGIVPSNAQIINCIISENQSSGVGGVDCGSGSPTIINCTITNNKGGGVGCSWSSSKPTISNCIIYGNISGNVNVSNGSPVITYSNIQGGWSGEGNIDIDPLFVESGYWDDNGSPRYLWDDSWSTGNYHLYADSQCINSGNNSALINIPYDIEGNPRIIYDTVDMGAYEGGVERSQFNLSINVIGNGLVLPGSGKYEKGKVVEIRAIPNSGYCVEGWYDANDVILSTEPVIDVLMDSDKTIIVMFEKDPDAITINKCNIRSGKVRSEYWPTDSIIISGYSFDAADTDFLNGNTIYVDIFNENKETPIFSDKIDVNVGKYKNGKFNYKGSNGGITSLKCDINKNTFTIAAKNIDLTGLSSPVAIEIGIGDYFGTGVAYDGEVLASGDNADIINGSKSIPIQLLSGYIDSLRVDKCTFKLGKKASTDILTIQGAIAVEDTSVNIAGEDVVVSWGDCEITLPANDLYRIGSKRAFKYKKPKGSDSSIAAAIFDLEKCTFKIIVKKANIGSQNNPVDFSIQFADFSKTVTLQLTEKKSDYWCFP